MVESRRPLFVAPPDVPLPIEFVQASVERSEARWVAFSEEGLFCETDDLAALAVRVAGEERDIWVTPGRRGPRSRASLTELGGESRADDR